MGSKSRLVLVQTKVWFGLRHRLIWCETRFSLVGNTTWFGHKHDLICCKPRFSFRETTSNCWSLLILLYLGLFHAPKITIIISNQLRSIECSVNCKLFLLPKPLIKPLQPRFQICGGMIIKQPPGFRNIRIGAQHIPRLHGKHVFLRLSSQFRFNGFDEVH